MSRLVRKKVRGGRLDILIDGVSVGHITGSARNWFLRPRHVVVAEGDRVRDPERSGVWISGDLLTEATEHLCDMQGLPAGIAWSLSHDDEDLTPGEEVWLQRFLGQGFADTQAYEAWVQQWQKEHLDQEV